MFDVIINYELRMHLCMYSPALVSCVWLCLYKKFRFGGNGEYICKFMLYYGIWVTVYWL